MASPAPAFSFGINQCTICDFAQKNHFIVLDGETMCKQCFLKNKTSFQFTSKKLDVEEVEEEEPAKKIAKIEVPLEEKTQKKQEIEGEKCTNAYCENILNQEKPPLLHPVFKKLICEPCFRFHVSFNRDRAGDELYVEEPKVPKIRNCTYCGSELKKRTYPGIDRTDRICTKCHRLSKAAAKKLEALKKGAESSSSSSSRNSVDPSPEKTPDRESVIQFCSKPSCDSGVASSISGSEFLKVMVSLCEGRMAKDE